MGLLDVLNGMRNGPRGQPDPNAKGGMSPITMAILALIAYKGIKHLTEGQTQSAPGANPPRSPGGSPVDAGGLGGGIGGGLGDLLKGGLGGLLAGGAAGSILSGGLGSLIDQLQTERSRRGRQFVGRHGSEQGHFGERSGEVDRHRRHRRAYQAYGSVARAIALRSQQRTARRDRRTHAGWTHSDRRRAVAPGMTQRGRFA